MDIDHFKEINDQFGHQTGDNLLEEYGNAIRLATRKNDYSSRLGGDEILMAFQNMTIEEAAIKAGKIRQKLQMITIEKDGNSISASVSIGIATYPLNGTSVNELISWADRALYAAKDKGRNQVVLASSVSRSPINKGK
jgi:diguanylate cyclase (GGDEF)-like protein